MYFIGPATGGSSIHRIFPRWAALAGIEGAILAGCDIPVGAPAEQFHAALERIREDRDAWGALVTTHKVRIWEDAQDLFTDFDEDAGLLGEVSCIVKRGARLTGIAIDTLTVGLALREFVEPPFTGHALILGAGGAGLALAVHLMREHRPAGVVLTDVSQERLEQVRRLTPAEAILVRGDPAGHDRLVARTPPGSLIVNATGMGKDRPGCPISAQAGFPEQAIAWDFNYRGNLLFLEHARRQGAVTVDGWAYFLHGWSRIMARVFSFDLTPELFAAMRGGARSPACRADTEECSS